MGERSVGMPYGALERTVHLARDAAALVSPNELSRKFPASVHRFVRFCIRRRLRNVRPDVHHVLCCWRLIIMCWSRIVSTSAANTSASTTSTSKLPRWLPERVRLFVRFSLDDYRMRFPGRVH